MQWSWRIGRLAGIDVRVHATFLLLLAWIAWSRYVAVGSLAAAVDGLVFIGLVFGIIVLHELGHALTARRCGIRTRDITLWPIGGVAALERMPDDPKAELAVALAGPAVNVVLAVALAVGPVVQSSRPSPLTDRTCVWATCGEPPDADPRASPPRPLGTSVGGSGAAMVPLRSRSSSTRIERAIEATVATMVWMSGAVSVGAR